MQMLLWHKAPMSYDQNAFLDVFCAIKRIVDLKNLFLYPTLSTIKLYQSSWSLLSGCSWFGFCNRDFLASVSSVDELASSAKRFAQAIRQSDTYLLIIVTCNPCGKILMALSTIYRIALLKQITLVTH
jgi:hypothetical protein